MRPSPGSVGGLLLHVGFLMKQDLRGLLFSLRCAGEALIDPVVGDVTPKASNLLGILYFGTLYGLTGHLQVSITGRLSSDLSTCSLK